MRCPFCDADKDRLKVIDSRTADAGRSIRRRRECLNCQKRFTTYERIEERQRLTVVKKDGRRLPWNRDKILHGLERACFKRPVPESELLRIVDEVEEETFKAHDREADSSFIGRLVCSRIQLRMASVRPSHSAVRAATSRPARSSTWRWVQAALWSSGSSPASTSAFSPTMWASSWVTVQSGQAGTRRCACSGDSDRASSMTRRCACAHSSMASTPER